MDPIVETVKKKVNLLFAFKTDQQWKIFSSWARATTSQSPCYRTLSLRNASRYLSSFKMTFKLQSFLWIMSPFFKSTLCHMSIPIIFPFVKSTTLILVQTVTAGAWHLVTKYKLSSQVLGSLLAGFWLLLLLLNPRPTSGWKQTKKYQHESCDFLVHCFHNVDKSFAGVVLAVGWIGRASWT